MTSYLDISNVVCDSDNLNSNDNSKRNVNFDDYILKLYAQEIEENQINEIIEAELQNNSVENSCRTAKEITTKKHYLKQNKLVPTPKLTITSKNFNQNMENQIEKFQNKITLIKRDIQEETQEKSNSNPIKPIVLPGFDKKLGVKPKHFFSYDKKESLTTSTKAKLLKKAQSETEITNFKKNIKFNPIQKSELIFKTASSTTHSNQFQIKETFQPNVDISNPSPILDMVNVEVSQIAGVNEEKNYMPVVKPPSEIMCPSLPSRPPPLHKYNPGYFNQKSESSMKTPNQNYSITQNACSQRKEFSGKKYASNEGKELSSTSNENVLKICFPYTQQSDVCKDRVFQNFSAVAKAGETSKSMNVANVGEKINEKQELLVIEENIRIKNNIINVYENQNSTILADDDRQIKVKPAIPKKPSKQLIQKRIEELLIKQLNNSGERRIPKQNYEVTKSQPNNIPLNNIRSENYSQDRFSNTDSLKTDMKIVNGRIAEITFFDRNKTKKMFGQNSSSEHKRSIHFEEKSSNEDSYANQGIDGQSEKQRQTSQQNLQDSSSMFKFIKRPLLPQKLKTTQRSVSYSNLVQTFKDFSVALWSPPLDKDKRASFGDISITNGNKESGSGYIEPITRKIHSVSSNEDGISCKSRSISDIEQVAIKRFSWFHDVNILEANQRLLELGQDGAFLIRPSSKSTIDIPYTASVIQSGKIFNIHIRHRADRQYAIGKEKHGEKTFPSVSDMVKYHQDVPFEVSVSTKVYFRVTPPR